MRALCVFTWSRPSWLTTLKELRKWTPTFKWRVVSRNGNQKYGKTLVKSQNGKANTSTSMFTTTGMIYSSEFSIKILAKMPKLAKVPLNFLRLCTQRASKSGLKFSTRANQQANFILEVNGCPSTKNTALRSSLKTTYTSDSISKTRTAEAWAVKVPVFDWIFTSNQISY